MNLLEQKDFLMQLCSRLDNQSLELLSKTSLWLVIREFAREQHFWYLRVQHLFRRELTPRIGDWKRAYYYLEYDMIRVSPESLINPFLVEVLLELGWDPSSAHNRALGIASAGGYAETMKLLLADRRVDPSSDDNYSIKIASQRGHIEVVRLLLDDSRVDPTSDNNLAIILASKNEHIETVKLLEQDPRVDLSLKTR